MPFVGWEPYGGLRSGAARTAVARHGGNAARTVAAGKRKAALEDPRGSYGAQGKGPGEGCPSKRLESPATDGARLDRGSARF